MCALSGGPRQSPSQGGGATPKTGILPCFGTRDSLSALQPTGAEPRVHEPLWLQHQAIAGDFTAVVSLLPYALFLLHGLGRLAWAGG